MNPTYKNSTQDTEHSTANLAEHLSDQVREGGKAAGRVAEDATTTAKRKLEDAGDSIADKVDDVKSAAEDALSEGQSRVGKVLRKAQDTAGDAKDAIVAGAGSTYAAVRDAAVEKADQARESLSDVGDRLAATLQNATAEGDPLKSRVLTSVAHGLTSASDTLRERSVADLTADVKSLARRHPGAFMAAAAVVGFAAARFIRSSSQRQMAERDHHQGPRV
jgi:gas vesicle protein